jgi:RNA polymerase sigma-70 factor (ECF subfamily)
MAAHPPPLVKERNVPSVQFAAEAHSLRTRARSGEPLSLEFLFRAYYQKLCCFARSYVTSPDVAEELVDDVFLRLWEQRESGHACVNPRGYLYAAVRNQALKHLAHERVVRATAARVQGEGFAPGMSQPSAPADDEVQANQLADAFSSAVEQLPARCREAYTLHHSGLSYVKIGETMGTSSRTVETQVRNAKRVLRRELAAWL